MLRPGRCDKLDGRGAQIRHLRQTCGEVIPVYFLYTLARGTFAPRATCLPGMGAGIRGCAVAPVEGFPPRKAPALRDIPHLRPWADLVSDCAAAWPGAATDTYASDLAERVAQALSRLHLGIAPRGERFPNAPDLEFRARGRTPPAWVALLRQGEEGEAALSRLLQGGDLRGVALIAQDELAR
jgi:hypothetical protein